MALPETAPQIGIITDLKSGRFIKDGSPLWWSTDYSPDPREHLSFAEFQRRLVYLGPCPTKVWGARGGEDVFTKKVYLYPEPNIPITILNLQVQKQIFPFLVTARPYHPKELSFKPYSVFLQQHPLETLPEFVRSGGAIELPDHFYPHIRGLFAGQRGETFFWYPLRTFSFWHEFGVHVQEALKKRRLSFIGLYDPPYGEERRYFELWEELLGQARLVDQKKPGWFDFKADEVSYEEFLAEYPKTDKDLFFYYPLRVDGIEYTLPLVVATRTHKESKIRKPAILGIYAENDLHGYGHKGGILRIRDRFLATEISRRISEEFGFPVDVVLFTPQPGRPKYERVSGTGEPSGGLK